MPRQMRYTAGSPNISGVEIRDQGYDGACLTAADVFTCGPELACVGGKGCGKVPKLDLTVISSPIGRRVATTAKARRGS